MEDCNCCMCITPSSAGVLLTGHHSLLCLENIANCLQISIGCKSEEREDMEPETGGNVSGHGAGIGYCFSIVVSGRGAGPWFNIKMSSYQYRKSHCGDKTIVRSSYLHNEISYTSKTSLYWIRALVPISWHWRHLDMLWPLQNGWYFADIVDAILEIIFFRLHWSLFLRVFLSISQHWLR